MKLEHILFEKFGYSSFRTGQKETIETLLAGTHTLAMLPTGTGKSLCYQLPAYLLNGSIIIVSPLLSLMQDQVEQLKMNGEKSVIALNSFLTFQEKKQALNNLAAYRFIFLSPEMLTMEHVMQALKKTSVALFVVDEAHCISQWGHDFRPDYRQLDKARSLLGNPLTLALTATATSEVRKDIFKFLNIEDGKEWIFSADRPNIALQVEQLATSREKQQRMMELVKNLENPGIIYFSSKRAAEEGASLLRQNGFSRVAYYHGGMQQEDRILIQQQFLFNELDVICATSAFGMGINKENIRFVIHYQMPAQLESYLQEIGRAGRNGEASLAVLLYTPGDEELHSFIAASEFPAIEQIEHLFNGNNATELLHSMGLTDVQQRFIKHYANAAEELGTNPLPYILSKRKQQLKKKQGKLLEIFTWLKYDGCRREGYLRIFEEQLIDKPERCCDRCGLDISCYTREGQESKENVLQDWRAILSVLLTSKG